MPELIHGHPFAELPAVVDAHLVIEYFNKHYYPWQIQSVQGVTRGIAVLRAALAAENVESVCHWRLELRRLSRIMDKAYKRKPPQLATDLIVGEVAGD